MTTITTPDILPPRGRTRLARWKIGDGLDHGEPVQHYAELSVSHHGRAGYSGPREFYYSVDLSRVQVDDRSEMRSFGIGKRSPGGRIAELETEALRYNAKQADRLFTVAVQFIRDNPDHPSVASCFDTSTFPLDDSA